MLLLIHFSMPVKAFQLIKQETFSTRILTAFCLIVQGYLSGYDRERHLEDQIIRKMFIKLWAITDHTQRIGRLAKWLLPLNYFPELCNLVSYKLGVSSLQTG